MGCFLACFGSSKSKRRKHKHSVQRNATSKPEQPSAYPVQDHSKTALNTAPELQGKTEDQLSVSSRKKVTFDSNVRTYEPVLQDEVADSKKVEKEGDEGEGGKGEALAKPSLSKPSSSEDSSVTSTGSYPSNHRYQNCRDSDDDDDDADEDEGMDCEASDLSDKDEGCDTREEFGDELEDGMVRARIDVDNVVTEEVESPIPACESDVKQIGPNPNARDRSVYVHPVLNPVENLTQWKAVKSKRTSPLRPQKENYVSPNHESRIASGAAEPIAKELSFSLNSETDTPPKKLNQEIPVDASLSNWLVSSERSTPASKAGSVALCSGTPERSTTSQGSNSVISHDDRPILGALTLEELKKFSATSSSPRKSPSRSPDEMPIIGTVGTYWNTSGSCEDSGSAYSFKGIPNTTSKYREDKRVNWHSTPFETRLEKALNSGDAAEAASSYVPRVF